MVEFKSNHGTEMGGILKITRVGVVGIVLPCMLSFVVYYGFFSDYAGAGFHREGFLSFYESGVVKYRVLGRELLLKTHSVVVSQTWAGRLARRFLPDVPRCMPMADPKGNAWFYGAIFIQNTVFFVGAALVLYALFHHGCVTPGARAFAMGRYGIGLLMMTLTQFVPTAYDMVTCFFFLAAAYLIVYAGRWGFPGLLICVFLGTLTRESAVITLAFFFAYHIDELVKLNRQAIGRLVSLTLVFAITYVVLRVYYGTDHAMWQMVRWWLNLFDQKSLCGILLFPVMCWMIMAGVSSVRRCWVFLVACLPYVIAMTIIANTWEIRLWVPVWLGLLVLAYVDTEKDNSRVPVSSNMSARC